MEQNQEAPKPHPQEVVDWLRQNAVPIATAEPGSGLDDLRPLAEMFAGARIVSLGEATHGTREFFQLKHRILELCVEELGFDAFVIEAAFEESLMADRYVAKGEGIAGLGVANMRFWTWDTEEVLELVEWMRSRNESGDRELRFMGYDMQFPSTAVRSLLAYLDARDPDLLADATPALAPLSTDFAVTLWPTIPEKARTVALEALGRVQDRVGARVQGDPDEADYFAHINTTSLVAAARGFADRPSMFNERDLAMAENTKTILQLLGPDSKVVGWAHNAHAQRDFLPGWNATTMGVHLDREFGSEQRIVGFAFGTGSAQAVRMGKDGLRYHSIHTPPAGSLEAALSEVGEQIFAVDLRTVPSEGPVHDWLAAQPLHLSFGAAYDEDMPQQFFTRTDPRTLFDILIFVSEATAARRNPTAVRQRSAMQTEGSLRAPTNLSFEDRGLIDQPTGWVVPAPAGPSPYVAAVRPGGGPLGENILEIARPWSLIPWGNCTVSQTFSAEAYRGKTVALTLQVRAEVEGPGNEAQVALLVKSGLPEDPLARLMTPPTAAVSTWEAPVTSPEWIEVRLAIDVPGDADEMTIQLDLSGNGRGEFASLKLAE